MKNTKRHLITAALPYANGPVHIGHLAGVYIPADIYSRYLRLKREDIIFICGSDEHGVPITIKARQEGVTPQQIVDHYHQMNKDSFERFGIAFDIYHRTSHPTHHQTASEFFRTLYDRGEFLEKETEQYFDEEAGQFLADRYITGTCPKCTHDQAYGDQCENCGSSLNATDLINPRSTISGSVPVRRKTIHWYLPLDKYEGFLKQWILEENKHWKPNVYGQCKSWLDGGLEARAVTRDLDWGIPVPIDGVKGKVLYVWFDAPIGYISATKDLTKNWADYWKQDDTRMIHFIGKDNIVFHCIIFPVMLKAEGSYVLPENVPANEFLNLENDKISTSRNWAVWLHEYLVEFEGKQDVLRYVLCANAPEAKDNDFTWKDFQARNNNELVAILGNFVHRALVLTHKYFNGRVPAPENPDQYDKEVLDSISSYRDKVEDNLDHFRFREALKEAMNLARLGNKYLADTEPWKHFKNDPGRVKNILYTALQITASVAAIIKPFLPFTAVKLEGFLNAGEIGWQDIGNTSLLPVGHEINQPELLFDKIEDVTIQVQLDKLASSKKLNEARESGLPDLKEEVSYEDFSRMDIRVARILAAEKVPKTDKLIKLDLDTGLDKRTVVSGIAEYFKPEEIIGKQVCILANLAPRKLRGIVSHGMVLLAEDANGRLVFVTPEEITGEGSVVL
ncbi:MAG: methionyl-tRNA synthetase [Bacteroides sp. SM23_62]|nr:MAG: methionyl-tRNA synthetase [Bacteroides sp. SM23_62]